MKKIVSIVLLLSSLLLLFGCVEKKEKKEKKATRTILSLVIQDIPSNPSYKGYIAFKDKLEELSSGSIIVEMVQLTKFGTLKDKFDTVSSGQFDVVAIGYSDMADIVPELELVGAPYIARDYEHFLQIMDSDYGQKIRAKFDELNAVLCDSWYVGVRHVTSNKPINSIADFKGLKIRIPPSDNLDAFAKALGATPVVVSFQEIYQALDSGEANSQENPLSIIESKKVYELQKYIAMTAHVLTIVPILANKERYASFTAEQRAWFDEAVAFGGQVCLSIVQEHEQTLLEKFIKEDGMVVTYPNKDELQVAMKSYYDELESRLGEGSISSIIEIK